ncbi:flagellar filament capping protein FliD [Sulfurimonas lithotrophica]|uniref:Flagellar hook-associated protein 2 n=1 Tax=Sulfurimonas lithotrophica TaxID=2590022 RepID=A0A5P8NY50_9BACT|nr:flagellar filament capping protein FliD [Sulfurimonas lithotrophica]QFR48363.1 flagellar filament capping protein FliD [Sulfurimonas lithotrophica]
MAGISSLGVGSGVLTADVIDQLKEADEAQILTPIENKVTLNNQKQDAYTLLSSLMKTLKSSASALSYDTIFDNKTVDVSGNAEVTVESGANIESFTLETVTLAKKDITKFGALASKETNVASGTGTLTIGAYTVDYDATTTLSDLAQAITDKSNGDIEASILQTGDGAYSLVVSSNQTGADQALTITDDTGLLEPALMTAYDAVTNPDGYQKIQTASDAEFKYNGITTTRSTNEVSDLILGVNITLKEEGDFSNVTIEQDTEPLIGEMQLFVDSYNSLMQNLDDMTVYDEDSGAKGVFNDESFVRNIRSDLNSVITSMSNGESLMQYGLDLDRSGIMSFDQSVLEEKMADDPDAVKLFFSGGTDSNGNDRTGIFETIDDKINSYTGYGKLLSNFETGLKSDATNLNESYTRAKEMLENRYEIMTKRFTAYDAMISKINAQFSSLQMMISAEVNSDS